MKVQVQHVFYLDFLLPSLDQPERLEISFQFEDYQALLIGRGPSEPLFLWDVGENLANSEFTIQPTRFPGGRLTRRVRDCVVDRLVVALEFETARGPCGETDVTSIWLERAVRAANHLLDHLRVVSGSHRVRNIRRDWRPNVSEASVEVPYTVTWRNLRDGTTIPMYGGFDTLVSIGGIETPHTAGIKLEHLCESLRSGTAPPLWLTLLAVAEESLSAMKLRQAVLDVASACEIRSGNYSTSQTRVSKNAIKQVGGGKGLRFADRFFHEIPSLVCGRSLKNENNATFELVQACYSQRNCLMHGGVFDETFLSLSELRRFETVYTWYQAAQEAVSWVGSLPLI